MDTWQQYTLRANTEYRLACYGEAILMHNNQELDFARHRFGDLAGDCLETALSRVLISHFNLADCYLALDQCRRAADCYLTALGFLVDTAQGRIESERDQQALMHAYGHLHTLWSTLVRTHGAELPSSQVLAYDDRSRELFGSAAVHVVCH